MSGISRDEWLAALGESMPTPDPSALTTVELAAMLGMARTTAEVRIRKLLAAKKIVRTVKIVRDAGGAMRRVPAFKLVTPKGKRA